MKKSDHANWEYFNINKMQKVFLLIYCFYKFYRDIQLYREVVVFVQLKTVTTTTDWSLRLQLTQERVSEVKLRKDCEEKFKVLEK